jgi:flagellar hook assembly protein FlgD
LPQGSHVKLMIYDMNGREVYKLVDTFQKAGRYEVNWEGIDFRGERVASGVYYYKIEALKSAKFRKMMVLR